MIENIVLLVLILLGLGVLFFLGAFASRIHSR
jgi:hypothetical protein